MKTWHAIVRKAPGRTTEIFCGWTMVGKPDWSLVDNSFPSIQLFQEGMESMCRNEMKRVEDADLQKMKARNEKFVGWKYEMRTSHLVSDLLAV